MRRRKDEETDTSDTVLNQKEEAQRLIRALIGARVMRHCEATTPTNKESEAEDEPQQVA